MNFKETYRRGFDVKINWSLKDSISDFNNYEIGPAIVELERLTDKKFLKLILKILLCRRQYYRTKYLRTIQGKNLYQMFYN